MASAAGGGKIEYTELLKAMHAGRRYDSLQKRKAAPPIPPVLVCAPADPFSANPRFLEDLELLSRAASAGRRVPRFTPLGKWRCGERLVHCDPSGAPHVADMLPIAACWRSAFGRGRPLPLWLAYTPGAVFALSRDAALQPWAGGHRQGACGASAQDAEAERALEEGERRAEEVPAPVGASAASVYQRLISECGVGRREDGVHDPIAAHAFERLWRYVFVEDGE